MALATCEVEYPHELRADFQETYGLNLDRMGVDYSYVHAAILMSQLPSTSRIARRIDPNAEWDEQTHFLAAIEYDLRVLIWQKTKDAQNGKNRPKPNKTPAEYYKEQKRREGFDKSLIDAAFGKEVVNNGNE